ncbi:FAD-dependent oxidoreductase [Exiguobacterium sp. s102]|uniref:flavin monoamine oxidase family protein n=1 Tax=Exiguobacterium sp. s102 TaxID=2751212 RepID=UPI001BE7AE52|nr:FAD-dependent oxidoreductase [Exiguobacterium sp. s102]
MTQSIAIIGAGVSGLYTASLLQQMGQAVTVYEARDRIGGRIVSVAGTHGDEADRFDLGPTWYWPDTETVITDLVAELGLTAYEQHTTGAMVLERQAGAIEHHLLAPDSIVPSKRLAGGMEALVTAIASQLPAASLRLQTRVTKLERTGQQVTVTSIKDGRTTSETYDSVVVALPPRLVERIAIEPPFSETTREKLQTTPTWMAGQAKTLVVYDTPFWREAGLSGFGMSWVGAMQEIHDASPQRGPGALFGFLRLTAEERQSLGTEAVKARILEQLITMYGEAARHPREVFYYDWAQDLDTATPADARPLTEFPQYRPIAVDANWQGRLYLAGTETDSAFGGHVEGALRSAKRVVAEWTMRHG